MALATTLGSPIATAASTRRRAPVAHAAASAYPCHCDMHPAHGAPGHGGWINTALPGDKKTITNARRVRNLSGGALFAIDKATPMLGGNGTGDVRGWVLGSVKKPASCLVLKGPRKKKLAALMKCTGTCMSRFDKLPRRRRFTRDPPSNPTHTVVATPKSISSKLEHRYYTRVHQGNAARYLSRRGDLLDHPSTEILDTFLRMRSLLQLALVPPLVVLAFACSATGEPNVTSAGTGGSGSTSAGGTGTGGGLACNNCLGSSFTPCNPDGTPGDPVECKTGVCAPDVGCVQCIPGGTVCVGNEVHKCAADGQSMNELVEVCDANAGKTCSNGKCSSACEVAADKPSNVGCEFWAVDLDQQDFGNDPASAPWGVALSNAGQGVANVTIEINEAPVGQPPKTKVVQQVTVPAGSLKSITLPTRELDCGVKPNDYASPGTCLSSNAYRITASTPIVVYQFNVFANAFSNDASLLLPTNALGKLYRVIGWPAGHPVDPLKIGLLDRSYVTVVGARPNTHVTVKAGWRIKGNPPFAATPTGGEITATIGPFDVINLETDDATLQDDLKTMADLSGTIVQASEPVAVFSGVETTSAPASFEVPKPPGWMDGTTVCCLDHLEEQMFPVESVGSHYVIARSPVRSTGSFREPDVIRFLGVAEPATVTTNLPAPYSSFTLQPGEVKTTWTQDNIVVSSTKPVMVGQILVSNAYVDGPALGDPSLTVFPPIEQFRTEYVFLAPDGWTQSWVVISAPVGGKVTVDGAAPSGCIVEPTGTIESVTYESRRCAIKAGSHQLSGDKPFGIVAYGYGAAGSYAVIGGADVKHVYNPPPLK